MTQAVIYARVSSREQEQEGYSIPAQLKLLRAYASKNGFEITEEFVDVETAKTIGRKAFGEMADFLKRSRNCRTVLVEKTDRLYRNFDDSVFLEKLDIEIHFVKTGNVLSKNAKAQTKFMHGIEVVSAKYYVDNLREEVIKGMREKAEQGIFPGHAPFGYVNNRVTRAIDIHAEDSEIVKVIFETYATGRYSLSELRKYVIAQTGRKIARAYLHTILRSRFYIGFFVWGGTTYAGTHDTFISKSLFDSVQAILDGHNKPRYQKHDIAFRGLLTCAHDDCTVTAELKKGKYVYYRCSGYRGKCELPRFREEEVSNRLGEILKNIHIPDDVLKRIQESLKTEQIRMRNVSAQQQQKLEQRLASVRDLMDKAYVEKLEGKISEDFWERKMSDWSAQEQQIKMSLNALKEQSITDKLLDVQRILELANKAYFLYVTRKPAEQAELLRKVLLNCSIDAVSLMPTYKKPFDMIFERAKKEEWSGRLDSNQRPPAPKAGALPGCATPRLFPIIADCEVLTRAVAHRAARCAIRGSSG
jgi:site-specific DNA recombinase